MLGLFLLVIIAALIGAYVWRVPLLARLLGQPEARVRQALERRKGGPA